jgi:mono/diheme cytochrome c family protein
MALVGLLVLAFVSDEASAQPSPADATPTKVIYASQGWTDADRNTFYTTSQGSHMMPYDWFKALRRLDLDEPFGADQLQRYGYLRNESPTNAEHLPIGFVVAGSAASRQLGMTCAACHTGAIAYKKGDIQVELRIDGAPASADFQRFLADLVAASRETLGKADRFDTFAKAVLGPNPSPAKVGQLKKAFGDWVNQFGEFMDRSLPQPPQPPWGPGRLDAFNMIFNRVTARDLDEPDNFRRADAPVSYPFLWNASRQDRTQWTGSVPNGLYVHALARNTGEVYGVFGEFRPRVIVPGIWPFARILDFTSTSADFAGLQTLEEKIVELQPPRWPRDVFGLDDQLAAKGKVLFDANCASCHGERKSPVLSSAWETPVMGVGTDPKTVENAIKRQAKSGLFTRSVLPPPKFGKFSDSGPASDILASSVLGSLLAQALTSGPDGGFWRAARKDGSRFIADPDAEGLSAVLDIDEIRSRLDARLSNLFRPPSAQPGAYEARVLYGIWATAPYLHNGSVASLWELLLPPGQRKTSFKVGSRVFDPRNVGFVTDQSPFESGTYTVDPQNADGNGNGGHEHGTTLPEADRWAIVEYLKSI